MRQFTWKEVLVCVLVAAAALVRIAAARGELWFDEVWTIRLVGEHVHSIADLFVTLKHDGNHILNSLVVYLVGGDGGSWSYRWPAVAFGVATVALAGWVQRRLGFATALAAIVLCSFSYLLVQYSSEARGYAYQKFFVLLAYAALWEAEVTGRARWEVLFAGSCIVGFLAHPLTLNLYVAAQLWTWFPIPRGSLRNIAVKALCRTILPGAFFGWLYWVNYRHMTIGGGLDEPRLGVIVETLSLFVGGPFHGAISYAAAAITLAVSAAAFWSLGRNWRRSTLYLYLILIAPALVMVLSGRGDIYPRYFLTSVLFLCLIWSELIGFIHDRLPDGRIWFRVLLAAFVLANSAHIARLILVGRGHYTEAIRTMALRTPGDHITALVDHPLRHRILLEYFGPRVAPDKQFDFAVPMEETVGPAEWILTHNVETNATPPPSIGFPTGEEFELVEYYPYAGLSGWNLGLYRRAQAETTR